MGESDMSGYGVEGGGRGSRGGGAGDGEWGGGTEYYAAVERSGKGKRKVGWGKVEGVEMGFVTCVFCREGGGLGVGGLGGL